MRKVLVGGTSRCCKEGLSQDCVSGRGNESVTHPTADSLLTGSSWVRLPVCESSRQHVTSEGGKQSSCDSLTASPRLGPALSTAQQITQPGLASQKRNAAMVR